MIVRMYIDDAEMKRLAQKALNFVTATLRESLLNNIYAVLVFDRQHVDQAVSEAMNIDERTHNSIKQFYSEKVGGKYICGDRKVVAVAVDKDAPNFAILNRFAHEFGHAITENSMDDIYWEFLGDVDDFDKAMYRAKMWARVYDDKDLEEALHRIAGNLMWRVLWQIAAEYISLNYYILLNTSPRLSIGRIMELMRTKHAVYWNLFVTMNYIIEHDMCEKFTSELNYAIEVSKLAPDIKNELQSLIIDTDVALWKGMYPLTRTVEAIHKAYMSVARKMPKDVFIENRSEYEELLKGLDINKLRADGVPFMDITG
jgi:hypothetical protein